jgi:PilZ domain
MPSPDLPPRTAPGLPPGLVEVTEPVAGAVGDRRGPPRRAGYPTAVQLLHGSDRGRPRRAYVMDRGPGGLRLAARLPIPVGTTVHVRACDAGPGAPWVAATVRWCAADDGGYELGCQFTGELPPGLLGLFG